MAVRRYRPINYPVGAATSVAWGNITGTLSNQTDLQAALDAKADSTNVANWDTAYGWGDHSTQDYAYTTGDTFTGAVTFNGGVTIDSSGTEALSITRSGTADLTIGGTGIGDVVISHSGAGTILIDGIDFPVQAPLWNTAYGWGDHGTAGYLVDGDPQEYVSIVDTKASSNEDAWLIENELGTFKISTATDAAPSTIASTVMSVTRVGTTPGIVNFNAAATFADTITATGAVTGSNLNVSNWDTAYTYSQVGHLPLAGGALTGAVTSTDDISAFDLTASGDLSARGGKVTTGSLALALNTGYGFTQWAPNDTDYVTHSISGSTYSIVGSNITDISTQLTLTAWEFIDFNNGGTSTEWNTAYGWGDHSLAGYLTSVGSVTSIAHGALVANSGGSAQIYFKDDGAATRAWRVGCTGAAGDDFIFYDDAAAATRLEIGTDGVVAIPGSLTVTGAATMTGGITGLTDSSMSATLGDRLSLYDNRLDGTNMYGFGVESGALYSKSPTHHRWYVGVNADGGTSDTMELVAAGLAVNGTLSASGLLSADGGINLNGQDINTETTYLDVIGNHASIAGVRLESAAGQVGYLYGDGTNIGLLTSGGAWAVNINNTTKAATFYGNISTTGSVTGSNLNVSNWDTAYGWGDHSGVYEPVDADIARTDTNDVITAEWSVPSVARNKTASYTMVLGDAGQVVRFTGATASKVCTIPANASVAFPIGTMIGITNDGSATMTLAITTDTMTWGKDNTTGTRTLAAGADCVILKTTATTWKVNGSALVT